MKRVRIIFETNDKKTGYIIDTENKTCTSGVFDDDDEVILEVSQQGVINNEQELCSQISWVLAAALKG